MVVLVVVDFIKVGDGGCRAWMVMVVVMMEGFDGGAVGWTMVQWQCYNDDWGSMYYVGIVLKSDEVTVQCSRR